MHIAIRSSWYLLMQLVTSVYAKIIFYPKYRYLKVVSKQSLSVHNHREINNSTSDPLLHLIQYHISS